MRGVVVLRPEPGNAATAARLEARGIEVLRHPLFAVEAVPWRAPDPARFDALLLTSTNAVRHTGEELHKLAQLPVMAIGEATAEAARATGMNVALTGAGDVAALVTAARAKGFNRLLHLAGRDRVDSQGVETMTVYLSMPLTLPRQAVRAWTGHVALLHSARAARRFAELVRRERVTRSGIAVAALSPAVLDAAGEGWAGATVAERPTDAALVARAMTLIDRSVGGVDKRAR